MSIGTLGAGKKCEAPTAETATSQLWGSFQELALAVDSLRCFVEQLKSGEPSPTGISPHPPTPPFEAVMQQLPRMLCTARDSILEGTAELRKMIL